MQDSAIAHAQEAVQLSGDVLFFVVDLAHAYAAAGRKDDALRVLTQLLETARLPIIGM
jgi:Flp pilus assembly protein TadD